MDEDDTWLDKALVSLIIVVAVFLALVILVVTRLVDSALGSAFSRF